MDGERLVAAADVPVGGGVVVSAHGVVVTRPEPDTFRAFGSECPHRQCQVRSVAAGLINCFCHGSRFRISDGSVAGGPSPAPLPPREIVVDDDGTVVLRGPGGFPAGD